MSSLHLLWEFHNVSMELNPLCFKFDAEVIGKKRDGPLGFKGSLERLYGWSVLASLTRSP